MRTRGFTLVDLAGTIVALTCAGAIGALSLGDDVQDAEKDARQRAVEKRQQDSTHLRGIHQAMVLFAQNNKDYYVRPSLLDVSGDTIAGDKAAKDTTANILSVLVFNGFIGCDILVSPLENNKNIAGKTDYEFSSPKSAVNASRALWDPSLSADFTGGHTGNISYAHAMPFGERLTTAWSNSFQSDVAAFSNRGPQIKSVSYSEDNAQATLELALPTSNTLKFFDESNPRTAGEAIAWRGNVAYQDNHIDFVESKLGDKQTVKDSKVGKFKFAEERTRPDVMFYDEPDDKANKNAMLGIFTKAGAKREDWTSIWD